MSPVNEKNIQTDELIHRLSRQAGTKEHITMPFDRALMASLMLSLATAILVVIGLSRVRPDLYQMLTAWVFQFKVATMALLACGGIVLVRACGIPGQSVRLTQALLPGAVLLLAGVLFDDTGYPLLGENQFSAPFCVGIIVAASLPGLMAILAGLRNGIPTRPVYAGALSGVLSGSLAALVYTIACLNDGPSFVAVWYVVAISITAAIGAMAGRYILAW